LARIGGEAYALPKQGRAIVLALAADGANVVAQSRNETGLQETTDLARDLPGEVVALRGEVTDEATVASTIETIESRFAGVDYVVNNAGKQIECDFLETTNEDWDAIDATNVRGPFWVCKTRRPSHASTGAWRQHRQRRVGVVG
jgi:NAD(P)-dependent dehydrogenase (short-subunit alcohol dehydrogenase family)